MTDAGRGEGGHWSEHSDDSLADELEGIARRHRQGDRQLAEGGLRLLEEVAYRLRCNPMRVEDD